MDQEVYMAQPEGYEANKANEDQELVCQLQKGLYRTKQARNL